MNQRNLEISSIYQLLKKVEYAKENGDKVSQTDYLKNIFSKVEDMSSDLKTEMDKILYFQRLELSHLLINNSEYKEALNHLEKARVIPEYENLDEYDKCIVNRNISYTKLMIGLDESSKSLILESKGITNKLKQNSAIESSETLKQSVSNDLKIVDAWENGLIKTIIEFEIPFPLIITDEPIEFDFEGIKHVIEIELINSPLSSINSSGGFFAEIVEDKFGIAIRTKIRLTFFKYINPKKMLELNILSEDKRVSSIELETIKVMNHFIERYRVVSQKYWIENIFHKMITTRSIKIDAGSYNIHDSIILNNQLVQIQTGTPWITKENLDELEGLLKKEKLDLWRSLLLDAKDYLFRRNYRESIYSINGALENFLYQKTRERLQNVLTEREIEDFLEGKPNFNEFYLKDYICEDDFNKALSSNVIANFPPTVFQILNKCHDLVPFAISKRKLKSLVYKIKKRRNDIIHGRDINGDLENDAVNAIKSFEKIIELFD